MSTFNQSVYARPRELTDLSQCDFYHTIDLPTVGTVNGDWDLRPGMNQYLGDVRFEQKRVLDIGTANGVLSFWIEARGAAEVISFDLDKDGNWDMVPFAKWSSRQFVLNKRKNDIDRLNNAYWFAHRLIGSRAKAVYGSVYGIPEDIGPVDISVYGSILLHLRDPFLALQSGLRLTRETVIVTDQLRGEKREDPSMLFLPDAIALEPKDTWWGLSPGVVARMLGVLGFEEVRVTYHTQLYMGRDNQLFTVVAQRTSWGSFYDPDLPGRQPSKRGSEPASGAHGDTGKDEIAQVQSGNSIATRAVVAEEIIRACCGEEFEFPSEPYFSDVPADHPQFRYIQRVREDGISRGSFGDPMHFGPDEPVTRYMLASFLVRARYGEKFECPAVPLFDDVPTTHANFRYIQKAVSDEIMTGDSARLFCPGNFVSISECQRVARAYLAHPPKDGNPQLENQP